MTPQHDTDPGRTDASKNEPDPCAPTCAHCGSSSTWWRSDGDVGCNDCPGITTVDDTDPYTHDARIVRVEDEAGHHRACEACGRTVNDSNDHEVMSHCPDCGADPWSLRFGGVEDQGGGILTEDIKCDTCGAEFRQTFEVTRTTRTAPGHPDEVVAR